MALLTDDPSRSGKYCKWDLKLIKAYYINEAFEIDGHPPWVEDSPNIKWTTKLKKIRSAEAVEREQERLSKSKSSNHGVRVVAIPELRDGAKWPTRQEWSDRLNKKPDEGDGSKMSRVAAEQEERARIKLEQMMATETP